MLEKLFYPFIVCIDQLNVTSSVYELRRYGSQD